MPDELSTHDGPIDPPLRAVSTEVEALQRHLLPAGVPVLPRVQLAARYLPAETDIGGDWFDALVLPDDRVALIVGQVAGHGVAAAAAMGQLRLLLRHLLGASAQLAEALSALDTAVENIRATVCVVLLDPVAGALEYCTAGHPVPLIVDPQGEARRLAATGAGPIGAGGEFSVATIGTDELADGEILLLHNGISPLPGDGVTVDQVITRTLEWLTSANGRREDIALLAAQLVAPPPELTARLPARPASLAVARERLDAWLAAARIDGPDANELCQAGLDLAGKAIEHALPDGQAFTLFAALADTGIAQVTVIDQRGTVADFSLRLNRPAR